MKRKKMKHKFFYIIIILIIGLNIYTLFFLRSRYNNEKHNKELMHDIEQYIKPNDIYDDKYQFMNIEFSKLKQKNEDTVSYLVVDGSEISYPVVQTKNNSYYLTHSFDKSKNGNGWIFLNNANNADFSDQNTIIFAHSSLFRPLWSLYKGKYGNNIKITIYQRNQVLTYKVFAVYLIDPNNTKIIDRKLDNNVLKQAKESSKVNFNVDVNENDSILTLSTCYTDSTQRVIVQAKRV